MLQTSIAWRNGQWLPFSQAQLSLDDVGFIQGVVVVERLRTIGSRPLDVAAHLNRMRFNCAAMGINPSSVDELEPVIVDCCQHNRSRVADEDFSIVVLVTPGPIDALHGGKAEPTRIVHIQRLNWTAMAHWYRSGQQLVIADGRNVPTECWSPQLKTRARLQYYFADQAVRDSSSAKAAHAGAILLDLRGDFTETSAANLLVVDRARRIHCPPLSDILNGISLQRTLRLAEASGLEVHYGPISKQMIVDASEVILTGTSACLWAACCVGDVRFEDCINGAVYKQLHQSWVADLGFDFREQAIRVAR